MCVWGGGSMLCASFAVMARAVHQLASSLQSACTLVRSFVHALKLTGHMPSLQLASNPQGKSFAEIQKELNA